MSSHVTSGSRLDLSSARVHASAQVASATPFRVITPPACWAYAVSFDSPEHPPTGGAEALLTRVDVEVLAGRVGVGWTNEAGSEYVEERFIGPGRSRITLAAPSTAALGRLVIRNANPGGTASEFLLHDVELQHGRTARTHYLVSLDRRDLASERRPTDGGVEVFDHEAASALNQARLAWLEAADLPVAGRRVLDVGCGVGHFAPYYLRRGCSVVGIDGREENISMLRQRHPAVEAHVADVQHTSLAAFGRFDVVHCFGLLYHLESPVAALRNIFAVCDDLLILETMICDSSRPLALLADETKTVNQALAGMGCRPSPAYVVLALNRVGFWHVYGTPEPPHHPDFQFTWRDSLDTSRDGHNLRAVFVASHQPLQSSLLVPLLDQ